MIAEYYNKIITIMLRHWDLLHNTWGITVESDIYEAVSQRNVVLLKEISEHRLIFRISKLLAIINSYSVVTSRPKKILESDGKDYNFISKTEMDRLIQSNR